MCVHDFQPHMSIICTHVQVPLKKTTTLELLPKPKAPAHGSSGASSSPTASAKDGTSVKLVVPESVYAPIPDEREIELRNKWFETELVSHGFGSSGWVGFPYSSSVLGSLAPFFVERRNRSC